MLPHSSSVFFFFNDTATTEIYTLSLHDALPISLEALEFLGQKNRFRIELYITSYASFQNASSRAANITKEVTQALPEVVEKEKAEEQKKQQIKPSAFIDQKLTAEAPISQIVDGAIRHAIEARSSAINIEL